MAHQKGYKYPRLTILTVILVLTFIFFSFENNLLSEIANAMGIFGVFFSGFLYAFSFTAFAATGLFLELGKTGNIVILALIGGLGALIGDLVILRFAKVSFENEFKMLYKEPLLKSLTGFIPMPFQHFLKVILALIIIASPFPDEAGVVLLSNGYKLPNFVFSVLSLFLNSIGIYLILSAGTFL